MSTKSDTISSAAAPTPRSELWIRVSSRVERLSLLDIVEASVSEFRSDPYTRRGKPVVRLDGDCHILLGWAENEDAAAACGRHWGYAFDVACLVTGEDGPLAYVLLGNGDAEEIDVDFLRQQAGTFQAPISAFDGDDAEVDECDERAVRWAVGEWSFDGHNPACDFAKLCEGLGFIPAFNPTGMIELPCQQQQAQAGQSVPAAEAPPASQPEPEADEIEPSVSYKLGPIDRRCRHWERVLREGVKLPMPEDVHGAGDLPGCYAPDRGEEELFGLDAVIQGEENHHRRSRGWSYWLHVRDPKTGDIETIQPSAARKTVIKDAIRAGRIDLPREILKGAGDIAALVRILSAIRAGLPISEIVDAE